MMKMATVTVNDSNTAYGGHYASAKCRSRLVMTVTPTRETNTEIDVDVSVKYQVYSSTAGTKIRTYSQFSFGTGEQAPAGFDIMETDVGGGGDPDNTDYNKTVTCTKAKTWYDAVSRSGSYTVQKGVGSTKKISLRGLYGNTGYLVAAPLTGGAYDASLESEVISSEYEGQLDIAAYTVPARTYLVTYDSNGVPGTIADQVKAYNASLTLPTQAEIDMTLARPGYEFVEWNTAADGSGTSYAAGAAYSANADLALHAIWKRTVLSVSIGDATAYRVDAADSTAATDMGTHAYMEIPFTIVSAAAAGVSLSVASATASDGTALDVTDATVSPASVSTQGTSNPMFDEPETGAFTVRMPGLATSLAYAFELTVTAANASSAQSDVADTKTVNVRDAYYPFVLLGDDKLYQPTADEQVDSGKTYYELSDGAYVEVETPVAADLGDYYEASGPKPGHGAAFGKAATRGELLDVGYGINTDAEYRQDNVVGHLTFITDDHAGFDPPTSRCFVFDETDGFMYWYSNGTYARIATTGALPVVMGGTGETTVADALKALGVTHGVVGSITAAASAYTDVTVTFGKTYAANPHVVACLYSNSTGVNVGSIAVGVHSISKTGCTVRIFNNSTSQRTPQIEWIAVGR